jgi:hypothetical protein
MIKKGYQDQKGSAKNSIVRVGMLTSEAPKPMLYLTDKDLPDLDDWEAGKTYNLEVTVKLMSKSERSTSGGKEMSGSFDITKVSVDDDSDDQEEED